MTATALLVSVTEHYGPKSVVGYVAGPFPAEAASDELEALSPAQCDPDYDPAVKAHRLGHNQAAATQVVVADVLTTVNGNDWSVLWDDVLTDEEAAALEHLSVDVDAHIQAAIELLAERDVHPVSKPDDADVVHFVQIPDEEAEPFDFKGWLEALRWGPTEAAAELGLNRNTVQRMRDGTAPVSDKTAALCQEITGRVIERLQPFLEARRG